MCHRRSGIAETWLDIWWDLWWKKKIFLSRIEDSNWFFKAIRNLCIKCTFRWRQVVMYEFGVYILKIDYVMNNIQSYINFIPKTSASSRDVLALFLSWCFLCFHIHKRVNGSEWMFRIPLIKVFHLISFRISFFLLFIKQTRRKVFNNKRSGNLMMKVRVLKSFSFHNVSEMTVNKGCSLKLSWKLDIVGNKSQLFIHSNFYWIWFNFRNTLSVWKD